MVAVISTGHSLSRILRYNEDKVATAAARVLGEGNCPFQARDVGLMPKLNYLERIAALNPKVTRMSVHISLNFSPGEELDEPKLLDITSSYMQQIGFGEQPWIAYKHLDAGHPHLHVVSLKVRPDGSRIDMQNIGRNQSEAARRDIEKRYGLIPAEGQGNMLQYRPEPLSAGRLQYGKTQTKKAIGNILHFALGKYRFTSLPELNALLGLYNIRADQGKVTSRTFLSGGLLYRALDTQGNPVGIPQKASSFHPSPTLRKLETLFKMNAQAQAKGHLHARTTIDAALLQGKPKSLEALQQLLHPRGIDMVVRKAANGQVYGVTFVDHKTFCVLNGSTLGKPYSAKGLSGRITGQLRDTAHGQQPLLGSSAPQPALQDAASKEIQYPANGDNLASHGILNTLLNPEGAQEYTASGFKPRKKHKKRKGGR